MTWQPRIVARLAQIGCRHDYRSDHTATTLRLRCWKCGRTTRGWLVIESVWQRVSPLRRLLRKVGL